MIIKLASPTKQDNGCLYFIVMSHILSIHNSHHPSPKVMTMLVNQKWPLVTASSSVPHLWLLADPQFILVWLNT